MVSPGYSANSGAAARHSLVPARLTSTSPRRWWSSVMAPEHSGLCASADAITRASSSRPSATVKAPPALHSCPMCSLMIAVCLCDDCRALLVEYNDVGVEETECSGLEAGVLE